MASPAFSIAASVSRLIFADSIEFICCSRVTICDCVCSCVCSCCFFRFRAALAAIFQGVSHRWSVAKEKTRTKRVDTVFVCVDVFSREAILLVDLGL